jgi:hypothetical protein
MEFRKKKSLSGCAAASSVGQRIVEAVGFGDFSGFENFAAIQTLQVLRVVVFGNHASARMFAGGISHRRLKKFLREL